MIFNVESKNGIYTMDFLIQKILTRSGEASLRTDVVMNEITPLFKQVFNITYNNYFISLDPSLRDAKLLCSSMGQFHHIGGKIQTN